jgi:hypothetical protein
MHSVTPKLAVAGAGAGPWYSHRWPWLIMLGPACAVLLGSVAAYLAFTREDALVVDDYYKQGKAINQDLRRDRAASALGLRFDAHYSPAHGALEGTLAGFSGPLATPFRIYLAHPTQPAKDLRFAITPDAAGHFSVALPELERAHWQVVVESAQRGWRLARSWSWPREQSLQIRADVAAADE